MQEQKKGISLIVLVITIIVMIILASAIIISLSNSNIITKAKEAVLKTDIKNFAQELSISLADKKLADENLDIQKVTETDVEEIKKYIPNFDEKYAGKVFIQNGGLVYDATKVTEDEKEALEAIGIKSGKIYTPAEIKTIIEGKNLANTVSTTDIAPYVEGLSKADAEKYTIFRGDLYYRYEKTTYEEQLELHAAEISILMGDANEDGMLTADDEQRIDELAVNYNGKESEYNLRYICNFNYDTMIDNGDSYIVNVIISGNESMLDHVPVAEQHPDKLRFVGDFIWFHQAYGEVEASTAASPSDLNTTEYSVIKEYYPTMTEEQSKKFKIADGVLVYNAEVLTETEKAWADQYDVLYE